MENNIFIYGLVCPKTNEIRYVGKTKQTLKKRLQQHLWVGNKKHNPHKYNWINQLKNDNLKPIIIKIELCNKNNWVEREKYWISQYNNLTNLTQGGEEGLFFSDEIRKKISEGVKNNLTIDKLKLMSERAIKYWSNLDNRKKQSEKIKGIIRSDKHKQIISDNKKNLWKDETYKNKMCKQSLDLWKDETYRSTVLNYLKSDKHKENVSKRFKNKKLSDEHKSKMSESCKNKKKISVNGVIYESIKNASENIPMNRDKLKQRLKSKNFQDYFYLLS
jgi:hypothetical protein